MSVSVTAAEVKKLRNATGMGMMECKKALTECDGDFEKARDWLRVKSGAKANRVAGREAGEGCIVFAADGNGNSGALVQVSCETDFVARDENLLGFATGLAAQAAVAAASGGGDAAAQALLTAAETESAREQLVMKVGENIGVKKIAVLQAGSGEVLSHYIHAGNKVAAMCVLRDGADELGRNICMHIAAMRPAYLDTDAVPAAEVERERDIFVQQSVESGKPEDIACQMAEGKLKKRLAEITLLNQPYVRDPKQTVRQIASAQNAVITAFTLLTV